MKTTATEPDFQNAALTRSLVRVGIVTSLILSVPLVAMQFTDEVDWSLFDFVVMGILLAGTGLLLESVARRSWDVRRRLVIAAAVLLAFVYAWAELAVGIFTDLGS